MVSRGALIKKGVFWDFGGPVGLILDSNTYVLTIQGVIFELVNQSDVFAVIPSDLAELIQAAESYCARTGYVRDHSGAAVHVSNMQTHLVEFCVPPNVTLPPSSQAGDRVPR